MQFDISCVESLCWLLIIMVSKAYQNYFEPFCDLLYEVKVMAISQPEIFFYESNFLTKDNSSFLNKSSKFKITGQYFDTFVSAQTHVDKFLKLNSSWFQLKCAAILNHTYSSSILALLIACAKADTYDSGSCIRASSSANLLTTLMISGCYFAIFTCLPFCKAFKQSTSLVYFAFSTKFSDFNKQNSWSAFKL